MLVDRTQNSARIADGNDIRRDILGDDATCADNGIVTDSYARQYDCPCTYPTVFADTYGQVELISLFSKGGADWVRGCSNDDVGGKHSMVAHVYVGVINECEIEVGVNAVAEMYVFARKIGVKRRLDIAVFAYLGKHFL